jgi:hypothetical protein
MNRLRPGCRFTLSGGGAIGFDSSAPALPHRY